MTMCNQAKVQEASPFLLAVLFVFICIFILGLSDNLYQLLGFINSEFDTPVFWNNPQLRDITKLLFHCQLAVDKNYQTVCPTVLYRANGDRRVFPNIHLDQVDGRHVYVPFQTQVGVLTYLISGYSLLCLLIVCVLF